MEIVHVQIWMGLAAYHVNVFYAKYEIFCRKEVIQFTIRTQIRRILMILNLFFKELKPMETLQH